MNSTRTMNTVETPRVSFWQRRIVLPIVAQLKQGITPEKIALSIALGAMLGIFPILGATTLLCGLVGVLLRLNQPIIQVVNYFVYPLQIALLLPFYRAGERVFGQTPTPLSIPQLLERFQAGFWRFLGDFGLIALQGIAVWCLVAPLMVAALYWLMRPVLRRLALRTVQP